MVGSPSITTLFLLSKGERAMQGARARTVAERASPEVIFRSLLDKPGLFPGDLVCLGEYFGCTK